MKITTTSRLLCWLCFAVLSAGCRQAKESDSSEKQEALNTDFITLMPENSTIQQKYPGNIEGIVNVDIKAQVNGYLEKIFVKEGDYVKKGQPLFKIKSEIYQAQVSNSTATLQSAIAAQANAKTEVEKMKALVSGSVVSPVQLKTAEANLQAANAQVRQAKAALGSSRLNADFALIKAPVNGYIGRIPNRTGNLIVANENTPLTTLSDISMVYVYFSLSEADFMRLMSENADVSGKKIVHLITADGRKYPETGKLEAASGNIDRMTGTISMKAVFRNPQKLLRAGGSADVIINQPVMQVLLVPKLAVKDIQDKYFVYRLDERNKVKLVPIEIEAESGNDYILKSGLKNGDRIAVNQIDVLNNGTLVHPKTKTKI